VYRGMGSGSGSPNAEGAAHGSALGSVQVNVDSGATSSGVSQGRPASGKPPRPKTRSPGKPGWTSTYHLPHPSTMLMKNNPAGTSGVAQGCGLSAFQLSVLIATVISVWMLRDYLERVHAAQDGFHFPLFASLCSEACVVAGALLIIFWSFHRSPAPVSGESSSKGNLTRPLLGHVGRSGIESGVDLFNLVMSYLSAVGFALSASGLYSVSLKHADHILKSLFQAGKVIPALAIGAALGNASYHVADYFLSALIVGGLMLFASAEHPGPAAPLRWAGLLVLALAVCFDAAVPNAEEALLRRLGRCKHEVILCTAGLRAAVLLVLSASSGELGAAMRWLGAQPSWQPVGLLLLQAAVAYAAVFLYLLLLAEAGSKVRLPRGRLQRGLHWRAVYLLAAPMRHWKSGRHWKLGLSGDCALFIHLEGPGACGPSSSPAPFHGSRQLGPETEKPELRNRHCHLRHRFLGLHLTMLFAMCTLPQTTVIALSSRKTVFGALSMLFLVKPVRWAHVLGLLFVAVGVAANWWWSSVFKAQLRRPGSGRIVDIGAILAPGLGKVTGSLRTLAMDRSGVRLQSKP